MVVLSCSLWGNLPKYCDGAIASAKLTKRIQAASGVPVEFWIYHDDTVPPKTLQDLQKLGCRMIKVDVAWKGERRAMWRFLALDEASAVFLVDADMTPELMLTRPTVQTIRHLHYGVLPTLFTWQPSWKHQSTTCVPACFTGIRLTAPLNGKIRASISKYARSQPPLRCEKGSIPSNKHRYANGYGIDEWYLRFYLMKVTGKLRLSIIPYRRFRIK